MSRSVAARTPGMPWRDWGMVALLAAAALLTRWPVRARLLPTWDTIQFALALREFDVVKHQPHPPGYILFVAAGRLVAPLAGDAASSLHLLAAVSSALTVALLYRLAWGLYGRPTAAVAALGLLASPLFWLHGAVGLSYAAEAALATALALAAWEMRAGRRAVLIASAVLLGLAGGVRQSILLLLGPLWLGMAWYGFRRWRPVAAGVGLAGLTALAWLVPMVWLSGGPARYVGAGVELYESTVHRTTLLAGGWRWNVLGLADALVAGVGLFLPVLGWSLGRRLVSGVPLGPRAWLLGLWLVPALAVFVGVHFGQPGYLVVVLPALYLLAARGVHDLTRTLAARGRLVAGLALGLVLGLHGGFFMLAGPVDVAFPATSASRLDRWEHALRAYYRFRLWTATAGALREREAIVRGYVEAVRGGFDPRDTVLVTELGNDRSYPWFRHMAYYLPEFTVYHLRRGGFSPGYLAAPTLGPMSTVDELRVPLPLSTRRIVWIVDHWDPDVPRPPGLEARPLAAGRWLYVLRVGRGATVEHAGYRLLPVTAVARLR